MQYYVYDGQRYRCEGSKPWQMERFSKAEKAWLPYKGDVAKILLEGIVDREHKDA